MADKVVSDLCYYKWVVWVDWLDKEREDCSTIGALSEQQSWQFPAKVHTELIESAAQTEFPKSFKDFCLQDEDWLFICE